MFWHMVILLSICGQVLPQQNNVCRTMKDYYAMDNNPNCWHNEIVGASVPDIIIKTGRPFAVYKVTTNDGYIITIFRMTNKDSPNKKMNSVFLQHGLITTSANWVSLGNDSLAFQLHNNGYDVWLGNYRGTQYSEEHINFSVNDDEYWDYSVDDVALGDIPAAIKFIFNETGNKIIYVGHSLGSTFGLMYGSEHPEEVRKYIKLMVLTAPAYTLSNIRTSLGLAAPFVDTIYTASKYYGFIKIASFGQTTKDIAKIICMDSPKTMNSCFTFISLIYGPKNGIKPEMYPAYFDQHPSGTSLKLIKHVASFVGNSFRKFDYGVRNIGIYNSFLPPTYDISKIVVPTAVIYAKNDWLTTKYDSINLYKSLSRKARFAIHEIPEENFNHIDFMFGTKAKDLYIDYLLNMFNNNSPNE